MPAPMRAAAALVLLCCSISTALWIGQSATLNAQMVGPTRFDSVIQLQLGNLLVKDGRYEEAVEALRRARRDAPPEVATGASAVLVTALLRMGDFESAFVEAEALATSAPRSADALATYADALWALGRFEESA